jgi:ATP-binding cassette subfamily B protein RaxB
LNPLLIQYVADDVIGFSEQGNLYVIASGFFVLTILQVFTEYLRGNLIIFFTSHLTEQFSSNLVRHILKLPLAFFEKRHKGDLYSKFQSIDHIQRKISTDFVNTVLDGLMIFINFLIMAIYSERLTAIVTTALVICFCFRYASYHQLRKQTEVFVHCRASFL